MRTGIATRGIIEGGSLADRAAKKRRCQRFLFASTMDRRHLQSRHALLRRGLALLLCLAAVVVLAAVWEGQAQQPPKAKDEGGQFYEQQIKPILVQNCFKCHS